jgi:hypothetical protein
MKDFLGLPSLHVRQQQGLFDASVQIRGAVLGLLQKLTRPPSQPRASLASGVRDLADFVGGLGKLSRELHVRGLPKTPEPAACRLHPEDDPSQSGPDFERLAEALEQVSTVLRLGADRDWVGLALSVSDEMHAHAEDAKQISRGFSFIRVLMSMYQAASVDEAKAIFQATLEEEGARERRYGATTVDVAALFAARAGYQRTSGLDAPVEGALYGLYAPFGVQLAHGPVGVLLYPIDLGAYLVATPAPRLRWQDALRAGTAAYVRPSAEIPIVVGAGFDYHPKIDTLTEWRAFGFAALELPLYSLH